MEFVALQPGTYDAALTCADLGTARLVAARDQPHLCRGAVLPDRGVLIFGLDAVVPEARINGHVMGAEDAMLFAPGAELLSGTPHPQHWAALSVDAPVLAEALSEAGLGRGVAFRAAAGLLARQPGLRGLARDLAAVAEADPARLSRGSAPAALRDALHRAFIEALAGQARPEAGGRALGRRVALVARAEDVMLAQVARPIYTLELAAALGVATRTLETAFAAVYGMSTHRFLRLRRLVLARRALLEGGGPGLGGAERVKTAALDHGFWHLGRFAHHYAVQFGESPSATLARARRATGRARAQAAD